jgi:hypothetical protein
LWGTAGAGEEETQQWVGFHKVTYFNRIAKAIWQYDMTDEQAEKLFNIAKNTGTSLAFPQ